MKPGRRRQALAFALAAIAAARLAGADADRRDFYAVEINGVVCGYSENRETTVRGEGREYVRQESDLFIMVSLLGSEFDAKIRSTAQLDPASRRARRIATVVEQGGQRLEFGMTLDGDEAVLSSPRRREPVRIALAPGTLVGGEEVFLRLRRDFAAGRAAEAAYDILEVLEEEVQRSVFRRLREESLELAGKTYRTQVIEQTNAKTGVKTTFWLAPDHERFVKFSVRDRSVYLADRRVIDRIKVADMDEAIFTRTNVAIADVPAIAYMKLKVRIAPTGVRLTAADLNGPGQAFSGTVRDNLIEGVLEIEQRRYDGSGAPPFPPGFAGDPGLKEYLEPERFIESDDPLLIAKAREIAAGAGDSWQAARRLSQWVSDNIAYAIPGGGSARGAYDARAGECGAHSRLLAALCRAVGIPARVVFGAMYVPSRGGGFGQHAWNEIFMGGAGWIAVDATAFEIDYIDSGHIRIAEVRSVTSSSFNGREITVLEHRLAGGEAAAAPSGMTAYLGSYAQPQGIRTLTVLEKEGNLALDIPGRMVLPFAPPDEKGRWRCKIAPFLYLVFHRDDRGRADGMDLHQVIPLPRKDAAAGAAAGTPAPLAPYVGTYVLAAPPAEFTVLVQDGRLAVHDPLEKATVGLQAPGADGGRVDEFGKNTIFFEEDGQGKVTAMRIDSVDRFRRGEMAAGIVEREIAAQGLEAGLRRFPALQAEGRRDVFFNEASFNALGYRYLAAGRLQEAIAIFKLNVREYPQSSNAYDSLGEAFMKSGRDGPAIENYRKSLELNPENENARVKLEELGKD